MGKMKAARCPLCSQNVPGQTVLENREKLEEEGFVFMTEEEIRTIMAEQEGKGDKLLF